MPATTFSQLLTWDAIETTIENYPFCMLFGPPGTGKTTAAVNAAKKLGLEISNLTMTDETPAATLAGHFIPKGGEFLFMEGPALERFEQGGMLILNEIDKASDDARDFLHALLDDASVASINVPLRGQVSCHPDFRCVATSNESPRVLVEAIRDRFCPTMYVGSPHPDAIAALPEDLRELAANSIGNDTDEDRPISYRRIKAYSQLRETIGPEMAATAIFAERGKDLLDALTLGAAR